MNLNKSVIEWETVREREHAEILRLAALMRWAWGNRVGLHEYVDELCKAAQGCGFPREVELLLLREAGRWAEYKWFWHTQVQGQGVLVEQVIAAFQKIDAHTSDYQERLKFRRAYLGEIDTIIVGAQLLEEF